MAGVTEKYRRIGGASPLPDITRSTAGKLEAVSGVPVYVGMLHWHPFLEDTVAQMALDGLSRALVICLVPHFSAASVGRYQERALSAAAGTGLNLDLVDSWHTVTPYLDGLAASIIASWGELGCGPGEGTHLVFSAHSLPKAALPEGDPYETQLRETAEGVAERLKLTEDRWTLAYQSASGLGKEWLGPSVEDIVYRLADQGVTKAVLCPFGFVADQVEILYDLDQVMKREAAERGMTLARTALLNDGPALIDSLALLVKQWKG